MNHGGATTKATAIDEPAETRAVELVTVRYADELRAVGQALEAQKFTSVELEVESDGYRVRPDADRSDKTQASFSAIIKKFLLSFRFPSQTQKQSIARSVELRYGPKEIQKLIQQGSARRLETHAIPNHFSLSHILRQAGAYLDDLHDATLVGVRVQDRWITIRYHDSHGRLKELKQDLEFFYDYWVKMYLRRSLRPPTTPSSAPPTYVTRS